jgi:hypothetical protein
VGPLKKTQLRHFLNSSPHVVFRRTKFRTASDDNEAYKAFRAEYVKKRGTVLEWPKHGDGPADAANMLASLRVVLDNRKRKHAELV